MIRTSKVYRYNKRFLSLLCSAFILIVGQGFAAISLAGAETLKAGAAREEITDHEAMPANDPLYAKALVIKSDDSVAVLITIDAVAIGELGRIGNGFMAEIRAKLKNKLNIPPESILVNASHCHGVVRTDSADLTVKAVEKAWAKLEPVRVAAGIGNENRIMENRRFRMKDGRQSDMRHAYAVIPDEQLAGIGVTDPEIGLLRLDRKNGSPLAVVYNFACHPIQGVPSGGNTADFPGFASKAIEENMGPDCMAVFIQGCGGDINPIGYKDVHHARDAETLGNMLGLSVLRAARELKPETESKLKLITQTIKVPKATDFQARIDTLEKHREELLNSLKGNSLNFKTFIPLYVQYALAPEFPSYSSHRYLHEKQLGKDDLVKLDHQNRANIKAYVQNVAVMEELTRLQTNLNLLKKNQALNTKTEGPDIRVEVAALKVGDFVMLTFPGELTVQIGLNIKKASPYPNTFVAGYTNGYIYYTPTVEQRNNTGYAQEDCDCIVAPEWQQSFENTVADILKKL